MSALASDAPPKYQRAAKGSIADAFDGRIRKLLKGYPTMPATVIGESIDSPITPTSSTSEATPTGCATVTSAASPQPTPRPTSHQELRRGSIF